jgi:hypothetical protein
MTTLPAAPLGGHSLLYRRFLAKRDRQAQLHGRTITEANRRAGDVIFKTAALAAMDVFQSNATGAVPPHTMRVVSLATGTSKSTSAYAYIAAAVEFDEEFSAAYIVPTIALAKEVVAELSALTDEPIAFWSSEEANVDKADLPKRRIVVVTHALWKREMTDRRRGGVRYWHNGKALQRRSVLFVDEMPDLVTRVHVSPSSIQDFFLAVQTRQPDHAWSPVLRQVVAAMNEIVGTQGQRYEAMRGLLTREQGDLFAKPSYATLSDFVREDLDYDKRRGVLECFSDLCRFLTAASRGGCFYSRQDHTFTAYEFDYDPGPGHVLMDATADLTGLTQLRPDVEHIETPPVSYSNLETVLVQMPRKWRRVRDLLTTMDRSEAVAFGEWVYSILRANTQPGDDVLMYAKDSLYKAHVLMRASDPAQPFLFEGRRIGTEHYGTGVGRNAWKDKRVVILVGDHYLKRDVVISDSHGWSGKELDDTSLKEAIGIRSHGDVFEPQGIYRDVHEGHLLRWTKQAAMRGNARNFLGDGSCGAMKLIILTSDRVRILRNWSRLFDGAPLPTAGDAEDTTEQLSGAQGYRGLADMLMTLSTDRCDGKFVERRLGIPSRNLPKAISSPAVKPVAETYGWKVVKAKSIGERGQSNWLFNADRFAANLPPISPEVAARLNVQVGCS